MDGTAISKMARTLIAKVAGPSIPKMVGIRISRLARTLQFEGNPPAMPPGWARGGLGVKQTWIGGQNSRPLMVGRKCKTRGIFSTKPPTAPCPSRRFRAFGSKRWTRRRTNQQPQPHCEPGTRDNLRLPQIFIPADQCADSLQSS